MAELKDMYRIVKFLEKKNIQELQIYKSKTEAGVADLLETDYLKSFRFYHRKPHDARIAKLIRFAHSDDYLKTLGKPETGLYFDLSRKGQHLIAKKYHFFRVGLWDESLKEYDKAQTVGILIATSILTAFGGALLGLIIGKQ